MQTFPPSSSWLLRELFRDRFDALPIPARGELPPQKPFCAQRMSAFLGILRTLLYIHCANCAFPSVNRTTISTTHTRHVCVQSCQNGGKYERERRNFPKIGISLVPSSLYLRLLNLSSTHACMQLPFLVTSNCLSKPRGASLNCVTHLWQI